MEKKQNVPALRFQGFSGEWEKKTLGDFGNVAMNRRIFKEQTSETGEIPFYKIGTFGKEPDAYISRQLFEEYKAKYPYPDVGDILLSAAGSIGKTVEYTGKDEYFQDSNIVWLKHDERLDNPFLKYFYSKVKWGTLEGGTVKRLYNKILLETEIVLPEIIEQKKIGKFFASYDRMIAHQEGKIRKLQQFRQAMLAKLFPREGAAEPELRFAGFSGPWERKKLGDVVEVIMGQSPDGDTYSTIPCGHILVQGNADLENGWVKPRIWTTQVTKTAKAGDLIMSVRAPAGAMGKTAYDVVLGRGVAAIKGNAFIYHSLVKMDSMGYWSKYASGSTFESLNSNNIQEAEITIPSEAEQEILGAFFDNIDEVISLQQKKLEQMRRLKAALLEKLFV